jgi:hypothetical protein
MLAAMIIVESGPSQQNPGGHADPVPKPPL